MNLEWLYSEDQTEYKTQFCALREKRVAQRNTGDFDQYTPKKIKKAQGFEI